MAGADRSLVDAYEDAVRRGSPDRDYLAQMVAASSGMNINIGKITAASPDQIPSDTRSIFQQFTDGFKKGVTTSPAAGVIGGIGDAADKIGNVVDATGDAIEFITDIPRVITTLLGIILIIAGIFALAKGPAVSIATGAVSNALTS